jgi:heterodisulfide reductase subunit C
MAAGKTPGKATGKASSESGEASGKRSGKMSGANTDGERPEPIRLDHSFRERLGKVLEGDGVSYCYQCGACVGDCPTARFTDEFNPRNIMLQVLYGMEEELLGENSPIWMCSNCFTCFDRCPQDVKPIEVIIALKNLMGEREAAPAGVAEAAARILASGRSAMVTTATVRRRKELGLPPLPELDTAELRAIVGDGETADTAGDGAAPPAKPTKKREPES